MKRQLIYHTPVSFGEGQSNSKVARITTLKSSETNADIKSISKDGLTLHCDMRTLQTILPNNAAVSPKQPGKLTVSFTLGTMITCSCNVIYSRRASKDKFILELRFDEINKEDRQMVDQFVDESFRDNKQHDTADKTSDLSQVA